MAGWGAAAGELCPSVSGHWGHSAGDLASPWGQVFRDRHGIVGPSGHPSRAGLQQLCCSLCRKRVTQGHLGHSGFEGLWYLSHLTKDGLDTEGPSDQQAPPGWTGAQHAERGSSLAPGAPLTRSRWASRSFCTKSLRALCTEATSTSGPWCPGVGKGHRSGERGLAGGLALCRPE